MPEAPEVEALALFLRERLIGHEVVGTELVEGRAWKTRARPLDQLVGRRVTAVVRYGKHIDLDLDGVHLSLGFGRAGWATWTDDDADPGEQAAEPAASPVAAVIARVVFDNGVLGITDAGDWLSAQLHLVDDPAEVPAVAKLGPDAIDPAFSREMLQKALGGRRKQLKALLQEQETLAGIGNAYSDEILFAARLAPVAHASSLSSDEVSRLFAALHDTLSAAVAARRGVPIAEQKAAKVAAMQVHGRTGEPCPGCGGVIEDVPGTKGGGQWCPSCQGG
ncbi:formamidopyrimidine-DNA glycosylase [Microbacterium sp. ru370.1]|uniref:Fpg/Nei family DNA glycosylase n=1 Tax=unclassified Microbacterium TaxID=2609290 RepID=UPI000887C79A|nr:MULTISPECIES: DNA-formamidopyrimidine glycosylase family protein [unclassified Microbacterium]SDO84579.1 formamidopyrimidine-DNA glycosylase [Microbacterium sp. ru370.1]SIT90420.1 formamidopyrimidine-DNA glycosylase [Microbacterium sp. RU1D]